MSLELISPNPINHDPLFLQEEISALPFDRVKKFHLENLTTAIRRGNATLLLQRRLSFAKMEGSFNVFGDLCDFKSSKPSQVINKQGWTEKYLPELPLIFQISFDVREIWQYLLLQRYQLLVELNRGDFFLHCDGYDFAVTEDDIEEKIKSHGFYRVNDSRLKEDTSLGTRNAKNPFPPAIDAISFLKITVKPYPEEKDEEEPEPEEPLSPEAKSKKLVLV